MKTIFTVIVCAILMASCGKQAEQRSAPEKMNAEELYVKYGIEIPDLDYTEGALFRGSKKKASAQAVVVWLNDLELSGSVTCTVSENAQWGGIQKFLAEPLSMDDAVSYCNFNWDATQTATPMDCPTTIPGVYRGWTSDFDYNIHISNLLTIQ